MKRNVFKIVIGIMVSALTVFALTACNRQGKAEEPKVVDYEFHETPVVLPEGTDGSCGTDWTYVEFGDWPQSIKDSSVIVPEDSETKEVGCHTYYKGNDGNWYAKVSVDPSDSGLSYSNGTNVLSGETVFFKVEPIKWRVLNKDYKSNGGTAMLLAENILTSGIPFYGVKYYSRSFGEDSYIYSNNYKYSQIRAFLNGTTYLDSSSEPADYHSNKGFLQSAFTSSAQMLIENSTVDNSGESTTDAERNLQISYASCSNTIDKIFLLSENEVTRTEFGFSKYDDNTGDVYGKGAITRVKLPTDYAIAKKVSTLQKANCGGFWMLRSPSVYDNSFRGVDNEGDADVYCDVDFNMAGVVPVLNIKLN